MNFTGNLIICARTRIYPGPQKYPVTLHMPDDVYILYLSTVLADMIIMLLAFDMNVFTFIVPNYQ